MPTDTFNTQFPTEGNWTPSQLKLAFSLYLQLPFGQFHKSNWHVQSLAALIGRSPSAVARNLGNFARPSPALAGQGLQNASAPTRKTSDELQHAWKPLTRAC